ncbi:MAG TPA: DUF4384 domain-containing protein, partial [Bacteroidales bacterium]|nr:DUF4384 domain-containing protein [Bacteroidales bacterium]
YITGDISVNQAFHQALNEAKVNAMNLAGISEHISSYAALLTSQVNNDFSEFFSGETMTEIQGAVRSHTVVKQEKSVDSETGIIKLNVEINAEVIRYETKPDPTFDAMVTGVKPVYSHGETLTFTVESSQNAFLHIFNITDTESFLLFPNSIEKDNQIFARQPRLFPSDKLEYYLEIGKKNPETNRLVFVFTKQPLAYLRIEQQEYDQIVDNDHIFTWIYSIPPDQRLLIPVSFVIRK